MSETKIECSECGGNYARSPWESAECLTCGKIVYIPTDILPNMEQGEHLIWDNDGHLAYDEAMNAECPRHG